MRAKKLFQCGCKYLFDAGYRFRINASFGMYNHWPDERYLKAMFTAAMGKELNLENPKTFNEKLQWLKLHDRRPEYTMMVDKYRVREYIASILGEEYLIPLLNVWDDPDEIDFNTLPNQFVLKCNHNSGLGMCICKDKSRLDISAVRAGLRKGFAQDYYLTGREWPYKDVPRKIICEQYMVDEETQELFDYKFMCFHGEVKCSFVCSERFSKDGIRVTFFDRRWNTLPFTRHYPKSNRAIARPENLDLMQAFAEKLAKNLPFIRVDFYEINKKLYFSELTLYPGSGIEEFTPEEWDYTLGSWLKLSDTTN